MIKNLIKYLLIGTIITFTLGCGGGSSGATTDFGGGGSAPSNTGGGTSSGGSTTGGATSGSGTTGGSESPPRALNDSYLVLGNAGLNLSSDNGPLQNDLGSVSAVSVDSVSAQGGLVTLSLSDGLTYRPPFGFKGEDEIVYEISNAAGSSRGTISITVENSVKFVSNAGAPGGDGSFESPFDTLGEGLASVANDGDGFLVLLEGDGSATGLSGQFIVDSALTLIGEGVGLNPSDFGFDSEPILPSGRRPQILGQLVLNGDNCDIRGISITSTDRSCLLADAIENVNIVGNSFSGGQFANILIENAAGRVTIENNEIDDSSAFGLALESENSFLGTSTVSVRNNRFRRSNTAAVFIRNRSQAILDYTILRNQFSDVGSSGGQGAMLFEIFGQTQGNQIIRVVGNEIISSLGRFIGFSCSGSLSAQLIVDNNEVGTAVGASFVFSAGNDSEVELRLLENTLFTNSIVRARDNADVCVRFEGNTATSYSFIREDNTATLDIESRDSFQAQNTGSFNGGIGGIGSVLPGTCLPGAPLQ